MKEYSFKIKIYAVTDGLGKVLYVGASYVPDKRLYRHIRSHKLAECGLIILRTANELNAPRIESQIIKAYKKRGQCQLNRIVRPMEPSRAGHSVEYNGTLFPSWAALARDLNCSVQTLRARGIISA